MPLFLSHVAVKIQKYGNLGYFHSYFTYLYGFFNDAAKGLMQKYNMSSL